MTISNWRSNLLSLIARRYGLVYVLQALHCSVLCSEASFFKYQNNPPLLPRKVNSSTKLPCINARIPPLVRHPKLDPLRAIAVLRRLPTCPSVRYFCSYAFAVDFGTVYHPPAALALNPSSSTTAMTRS